MRKFKTQYDERKRIHAKPGSPIHQTYRGFYDDDGVLQLIPDQVINTYDEIQSHRDSCDLQLLLKRYIAGDTECINKVQGVYGDFAFMPKDYTSLLNRVSDGRKLFDSLTANVKAEFNNSYEQFLVSMERPDFWTRLSKYTEDPVKPPVIPEAAKEVVSE